MTIRTTTHTVSKGECAWNVAQRTLQKKGGKVTTADITKEMQRLAKLNNCDSVEDFNKKFFSKVGSEFVIDKKEVQGQQQRSVPLLAPDTLNPDSTLRQDNTRVSRDTLVQRQNNTTKTEILTPPDLVKDSDRKAPVKSQPKLTAKEQEVLRINSMKDDASRIIEYNKKNYEGEHYAIVDKKKCTLSVYDKDGNVVKSFTVGVGKKVGDQLGSYYLDRAYKTKDAWKAEQGRYTTPGEFTLDEVKSTSAAYTGKDGKPKMMTLRGDNKGVRAGNQAIHMLYKPAYATIAANTKHNPQINLKALELLAHICDTRLYTIAPISPLCEHIPLAPVQNPQPNFTPEQKPQNCIKDILLPNKRAYRNYHKRQRRSALEKNFYYTLIRDLLRLPSNIKNHFKDKKHQKTLLR